jgi:hypothetical protein
MPIPYEQYLLTLNSCTNLLLVGGSQKEDDILRNLPIVEPTLKDYPLTEILGELVSKGDLVKKDGRYFLAENAYSHAMPFV